MHFAALHFMYKNRSAACAAEQGVSSTRIVMSILQNAIDSIAIGLEDYESTDDRRMSHPG